METEWAYDILGIIVAAFCLVGVIIIFVLRTIYILNKDKIQISERAVE